MPKANLPIFYVYEHWRPDKDVPFYVGKGHGPRANNLSHRKKHHKNIQTKLARLGMCVEVRLVAEGLVEMVALALEVERIALWRAAGVKLTNITEEGKGTVGVRHSPERRKQIGDSKRGNKYRLGAKLSDETKAKIGNAHRGRALSEAHKTAVSNAVSGEKNGFFGKSHSDETRQKIAAANRRRVWSAESKEKLSTSLRKRPPQKRTVTWTLTEDTKKKMSDAAKLRWAKRRQSKCPTEQ